MLHAGEARKGGVAQTAVPVTQLFHQRGGRVGVVAVADLVQRQPAHRHVGRPQQGQPFRQRPVVDRQPLEDDQGGGRDAEVRLGGAGE